MRSWTMNALGVVALPVAFAFPASSAAQQRAEGTIRAMRTNSMAPVTLIGRGCHASRLDNGTADDAIICQVTAPSRSDSVSDAALPVPAMDPARTQRIRTGAIVGIIAGGALGASLGYAASDDQGGSRREVWAIVGGVIGALVLGLVGAGVGAILP